MKMKFGQHHLAKGGFWSLEHYIDGVHSHIILKDDSKSVARHRAETIVADLNAGALRRANGESVPMVEPKQVLPYSAAGFAEHPDGVWMGEAEIGGLTFLLTAPGTTYDEGKAALTILISDLVAGDTATLSANLVGNGMQGSFEHVSD